MTHRRTLASWFQGGSEAPCNVLFISVWAVFECMEGNIQAKVFGLHHLLQAIVEIKVEAYWERTWLGLSIPNSDGTMIVHFILRRRICFFV